MGSWMDVDGRLGWSPVHSDPNTFDTAAAHFANVAYDTRSTIARFSQLTNGGAAEFQGQTAEKFATTLRNISERLQDVPTVADSVHTIMAEHASSLRALQGRVDQALARALTARHQRDVDSQHAADSKSTLSWAQKQLAQVKAASAGGDQSQVHVMENKVSSARNAVTAATNSLSHSQAALDGYVRQYGDFATEEAQLDAATANRIRHVDLKTLGNPDGLHRFLIDPLNNVWEGMVEFKDDIVDAATAAWHHDWDTALWKLHDILGTIGSVLFVAVVVIGLIGAGLCLAGAAVPALLILVAGLVVTAGLVVGTANAYDEVLLYSSGAADPETGKRMSGWQMGADVALTILSLGLYTPTLGVGPKGSLDQIRNADGTFADKGTRFLYHVDEAKKYVDTGKDLKEHHDAGQSSDEDLYVPDVRIESMRGPRQALLVPVN